MVTVAVIGVMAGSVVVGFNGFGQTVRIQETGGVLTDTLKRLELETIRRDYEKSTVHFEENFLVLESEVEGQTLTLNYFGPDDCPAGEVKIEVDATSQVSLAQRDEYGNNMEISSYGPSGLEEVCINFLDAPETEWQYQAFNSGNKSQVIRFLHFNIRRDSADPVTVSSNPYTLEISAPYAKKVFYNADLVEAGTVALTLSAEGSEPLVLTLQE